MTVFLVQARITLDAPNLGGGLIKAENFPGSTKLSSFDTQPLMKQSF